jgi:hypothetical protein
MAISAARAPRRDERPHHNDDPGAVRIGVCPASSWGRQSEALSPIREAIRGARRPASRGTQSKVFSPIGKQRGFGVRPASSLELHFEALLLLGEALDELLRHAFDRVECLHQLLAARA